MSDENEVSGILGIDSDKINLASANVSIAAIAAHSVIIEIQTRGLLLESTILGIPFSLTIRIPQPDEEET
jgi:hypothetical protein